VVSADKPTQRRVVLEKAATDAAKAWADRCMIEIRNEGRPLAGGWPGTLSEARGWARAELSTRLTAPTHEELEWLAHTTYSRARDVWLARAGDDEEPVDLEATG
jgi:hypothetical protein